MKEFGVKESRFKELGLGLGLGLGVIAFRSAVEPDCPTPMWIRPGMHLAIGIGMALGLGSELD